MVVFSGSLLLVPWLPSHSTSLLIASPYLSGGTSIFQFSLVVLVHSLLAAHLTTHLGFLLALSSTSISADSIFDGGCDTTTFSLLHLMQVLVYVQSLSFSLYSILWVGLNSSGGVIQVSLMSYIQIL
jgi:hypothetical protein